MKKNSKVNNFGNFCSRLYIHKTNVLRKKEKNGNSLIKANFDFAKKFGFLLLIHNLLC